MAHSRTHQALEVGELETVRANTALVVASCERQVLPPTTLGMRKAGLPRKAAAVLHSIFLEHETDEDSGSSLCSRVISTSHIIMS